MRGRRALAVVAMAAVAGCGGAGVHVATLSGPVTRPLAASAVAAAAGAVPASGRGSVAARGSAAAPAVSPLLHAAISTTRTVTLTFDDGPYPRTTAQILALLHRAHVHAVFCEIGSRAARYPAMVRAVVADGNLLCDHSLTHPDNLDRLSAATQRRQVLAGLAAIERASGGVAPRFFRAPQGRWTPVVYRTAAEAGLTNLYWTVDPHDWARLPAPLVIRRVLASLRPGGIILLHDRDINAASTIPTLRALLTRLPAMGYRFVLPAAGYRFSLSQAVAADAGTRAFTARWHHTHPHWHSGPTGPGRPHAPGPRAVHRGAAPRPS